MPVEGYTDLETELASFVRYIFDEYLFMKARDVKVTSATDELFSRLMAHQFVSEAIHPSDKSLLFDFIAPSLQTTCQIGIEPQSKIVWEDPIHIRKRGPNNVSQTKSYVHAPAALGKTKGWVKPKKPAKDAGAAPVDDEFAEFGVTGDEFDTLFLAEPEKGSEKLITLTSVRTGATYKTPIQALLVRWSNEVTKVYNRRKRVARQAGGPEAEEEFVQKNPRPKFPVYLTERAIKDVVLPNIPDDRPATTDFWESQGQIGEIIAQLLNCSVHSTRMSHFVAIAKSRSLEGALQCLSNTYSRRGLRAAKYTDLMLKLRTKLAELNPDEAKSFPYDLTRHPVFALTYMRMFFSFRVAEHDILFVLKEISKATKALYKSLHDYLVRRSMTRNERARIFAQVLQRHSASRKRVFEDFSEEKRAAYFADQLIPRATETTSRQLSTPFHGKNAKRRARHKRAERLRKFEDSHGIEPQSIRNELKETCDKHGLSYDEVLSFLPIEAQGMSDMFTRAFKCVGDKMSEMLTGVITKSIGQFFQEEESTALLWQARVASVVSTLIAMFRGDMISFATSAITALASFFAGEVLLENVKKATTAVMEWFAGLGKKRETVTYECRRTTTLTRTKMLLQVDEGHNYQKGPQIASIYDEGDEHCTTMNVPKSFLRFVGGGRELCLYWPGSRDTLFQAWHEFLLTLEAAAVDLYGSEVYKRSRSYFNLSEILRIGYSASRNELIIAAAKPHCTLKLDCACDACKAQIEMDDMSHIDPQSFVEDNFPTVSAVSSSFFTVVKLLVGQQDISVEEFQKAKREATVLGRFNASCTAVRNITSTASFVVKTALEAVVGYDCTDERSHRIRYVFDHMTSTRPPHCSTPEEAEKWLEIAQLSAFLIGDKATPVALLATLRDWCSPRVYDQVKRVQAIAQARQVPIGLLFVGQNGVGKTDLANYVTAMTEYVTGGHTLPENTILSDYLMGLAIQKCYKVPTNTTEDNYWEGYDPRVHTSLRFEEILVREDPTLSGDFVAKFLEVCSSAPYFPPMAFGDKHTAACNAKLVCLTTTVKRMTKQSTQCDDLGAFYRRIDMFIEPVSKKPVSKQFCFVASRHFIRGCECGYCDGINKGRTLADFNDDHSSNLEKVGMNLARHPDGSDLPIRILSTKEVVQNTIMLMRARGVTKARGLVDDDGLSDMMSELVTDFAPADEIDPQAPRVSPDQLMDYCRNYGLEPLSLTEYFASKKWYLVGLVAACLLGYIAYQKLWTAVEEALDPQSAEKEKAIGSAAKVPKRKGADMLVIQSQEAEDLPPMHFHDTGMIDDLSTRIGKYLECLQNVIVVKKSGKEISTPCWIFNRKYLLPGHLWKQVEGECVGIKHTDGRDDAHIIAKYQAHVYIEGYDLALVQFGGIDQQNVKMRATLENALVTITDLEKLTGNNGYFVKGPGSSSVTKQFLMCNMACLGPTHAPKYRNGIVENKDLLVFDSTRLVTMAGDCGSSYWMRALGKQSTYYCVAYHIAGQSSCVPPKAYGVPVSREMIRSAIEAIDMQLLPIFRGVKARTPEGVAGATNLDHVPEELRPQSVTEAYLDCEQGGMIPLDFYLSQKVSAYLPQTTNFRRTPLFGFMGPPVKKVAHLRPVVRDGVKLCDPYWKLGKSFTMKEAPECPKFVTELMPALERDFLNRYAKTNLIKRKLTYAEAVLGEAYFEHPTVPGLGHTLAMGPMDLTTAVGSFYNKTPGLNQRSSLVRVEDGVVKMHPTLVADMDDLIGRAERSEPLDGIFTGNLKDETLSARPLDTHPCGVKETRWTYCDSLHRLIPMRSYFGMFAMMNNANTIMQDGVGFNPHSPEAVADLVAHIRPDLELKGDVHKLLFGDFANWDGSMPTWVFGIAAYLINLWYGDPECKTADSKVRRALIMSAIYSWRIIKNGMFSSDGNLPSGMFLTTSLNNLCNFIIHYITFAYMWRDDPAREAKLARVRYAFTGDDNISNPRVLIDPYEFAYTVKLLFGMKITNSAKDGPPDYVDVSNLLDMSKVEYVSRTFQLREYGWAMPLNFRAVVEAPYLTRGKTKRDVENSVRSMFVELTHYPEDVWDEVIKNLREHPGFMAYDTPVPPYQVALYKRISNPHWAVDQEDELEPQSLSGLDSAHVSPKWLAITYSALFMTYDQIEIATFVMVMFLMTLNYLKQIAEMHEYHTTASTLHTMESIYFAIFSFAFLHNALLRCALLPIYVQIVPFQWSLWGELAFMLPFYLVGFYWAVKIAIRAISFTEDQIALRKWYRAVVGMKRPTNTVQLAGQASANRSNPTSLGNSSQNCQIATPLSEDNLEPQGADAVDVPSSTDVVVTTETVKIVGEAHGTPVSIAPSNYFQPGLPGEDNKLLERQHLIGTYTWTPGLDAGDHIHHLDAYPSMIAVPPIADVLKRYDYFTYDFIELSVHCTLPEMQSGIFQLVGSPVAQATNFKLSTSAFLGRVQCGRTETGLCAATMRIAPYETHRYIPLRTATTAAAHLYLQVYCPLTNNGSGTVIDIPVQVFGRFINPRVYVPREVTAAIEPQGPNIPPEIDEEASGEVFDLLQDFAAIGSVKQLRIVEVPKKQGMHYVAVFVVEVDGQKRIFKSPDLLDRDEAKASVIRHALSCYVVPNVSTDVVPTHLSPESFSSLGARVSHVFSGEISEALANEADQIAALLDCMVVDVYARSGEIWATLKGMTPMDTELEPQSDVDGSDDVYFEKLIQRVVNETLKGAQSTGAPPQSAEQHEEAPSEPKSIVSDVLDKVVNAAAFIAPAFLDKPIMASQPAQMQPDPINSEYPSGPACSNPLAMQRVTQTADTPAIGGVLDFVEQMELFVPVASFQLTSSDYYTLPIAFGPTEFGDYYTNGITAPYWYLHPNPHLDALMFAAFYRGLPTFRFTISVSSVQSTRLQFVFALRGTPYAPSGAWDPSQLPSIIVDVTGPTVIEFQVPMPTHDFWMQRDFGQWWYEGYGWVGVRTMMGPITSMDVAVPRITMTVEKRLDHAELANLAPIGMWEDIPPQPPPLLDPQGPPVQDIEEVPFSLVSVPQSQSCKPLVSCDEPKGIKRVRFTAADWTYPGERERKHTSIEVEKCPENPPSPQVPNPVEDNLEPQGPMDPTAPMITNTFLGASAISETGLTTVDRFTRSDLLQKPTYYGTIDFTGTFPADFWDAAVVTYGDFINPIRSIAGSTSGSVTAVLTHSANNPKNDAIRHFLVGRGSNQIDFCFTGTPCHVNIGRKQNSQGGILWNHFNDNQPSRRVMTQVQPFASIVIPYTALSTLLTKASENGRLSELEFRFGGISGDPVHVRAVLYHSFCDDFFFAIIRPSGPYYCYAVPP